MNKIVLITGVTDEEVFISELAEKIKTVVRRQGKLSFNLNKPDDTMRKLIDVSKLNNLRWKPNVTLVEGISKLYNWYTNKLTKIN